MEHLLAAIQTAILLGWPPITLAIFATAAELFTEEGDQEYAALLATFTAKHPASQARVKERAEELLSRLEGQLSDEELAKVRQHTQESDLNGLAAQLLNDLEASI